MPDIQNKTPLRIPLSVYGVDLFASPHDVIPGFAILMQNCYHRKGVQGRLGHAKHSANEVQASKPICGITRFYAPGVMQLLAACGTKVAYLDEGTDTWVDVQTGLTDGAQTYFETWSAVNKVYFANGADGLFSYDGTTTTSLAAFPADTVMVLPYRDKLLYFTAGSSLLKWTEGSYLDAAVILDDQAERLVKGGSITVIAYHALAGEQEGINSKVLVASPTSCALFSGTDIDPASPGYNGRMDHLSDTIGTSSPLAAVPTPAGTIILGSDKQLYLIPYGSFQVVPIGNLVRSSLAVTYSIESIPDTRLSAACAIYHDGFYKLAFSTPGSLVNDRQIWLDVSKLYEDKNKGWGPWYGPMVGMPPISCFATQNGSGDDQRLIGGHGGASGYVYRCNEPGIYDDDAAAIQVVYQTHHQLFHESAVLDVVLEQLEIEMRSLAGALTILFIDTIGPAGDSLLVPADVSGLFHGEFYYGEEYYRSLDTPVRRPFQLHDQNPRGRQLATVFDYSSSTDRFELYALREEGAIIESTFGE